MPTEERERVELYQQIFEELKKERGPWEDLWEDTCKYVLPERDMWDDDDQHILEDKKRGKDIYDTRAVTALQTLANGLIGYNVGPMIQWFKLKLVTDELNDLPGVKDWLEACESRIYTIFHRSNFYDSVNEFYQDLVSVGTATMIVEEDFPNMAINFDCRHPKETYIVESPNDRVDSAYRVFWLTGRNALKRYEGKLPEKLEKDMKDQPTERWKFIHVVQPRSDRVYDSRLPQNKPVMSVEFLPGEDVILRESGYDDMPILVARWRKNSSEVYGRSPAMSALPTIKRCNQHVRAMLRAGQLAVEPPLQGPREMEPNLNLTPFGYNAYSNSQNKITPLTTYQGYPFGKDLIDQFHEQIDDHFLVELFLMLQRATRQMTAREVVERQGEKVAALSGPLTRQNHEFLGPVIKRTFNIAMRAMWLPPPPQILMKTGVPLDVDFTGLLAQSQKRYHQSNSLNAGLSVIAGLVQFDQGVLDNFDFDDLSRKIADAEGFPQSSIRETPDVMKIRAQKAKMMQQQMQMAQAQQASEVMKNTKDAPEPGSPGEAIANQMAQATQAVNK